MRLIFSILLLIFFRLQPLKAQTEWFSVDTNTHSEGRELRQVINVINEQTNELVVFFRYNTFLIANIYNVEGELVNTFRTEILPKHKHNYFGTSINGNIYTLFFQNEYGTKFSALTLNFDTSGFQFSNKLDISLKSEILLGSFEYKSKIHLLTSLKRSSKLKIYQLNNHKEHTETIFPFHDIDLRTPNGFETNLNRVLVGDYADSKAAMINHGEPTSLEMVTKINKLYINGDKLILTNDADDLNTTVVSINLDTKKAKHHNFAKPSFDKKDRGNKSNSYILDNHLFSLYVSKEKLDFSVFNIETKALLKNIVISENDSIAFKNSPMILEGGEFQNYRELEKTKQFLRKISNSNPGLTVYKNDGKYVVTLGSSETKTQNTYFAFYGAGVVGGIISGLTTSILTSSFFAYTKTKSTRIECLFDEELNSIEGTIPENNFDTIENYIESLEDTKLEFKSIFKTNGNYVLGYFDEDSGLYKYLNF